MPAEQWLTFIKAFRVEAQERRSADWYSFNPVVYKNELEDQQGYH